MDQPWSDLSFFPWEGLFLLCRSIRLLTKKAFIINPSVVFLSISSRPPELTHSDPRSPEEARAPTTLRYNTPSFPGSGGGVYPSGETVYGCRYHSHTADSHANNILEFRQADGNQSD